MNVTYKNKKLEKKLTNLKSIKKHFGEISKKLYRRVQALESAESLKDLYETKSLRCHMYAGDRKGEYSIDIYKNWRVIFKLNYEQNEIPKKENGEIIREEIKKITIINIEDPH